MSGSFWKREDLYEQVWNEPLTKVAQRYGVSDVAVAKACRKLEIPLPGRGYWARKANGYAVEQRLPLTPLQHVSLAARQSPTLTPRATARPEPNQKVLIPEEFREELTRIDELLASGAFNVLSSRRSLRRPLITAARGSLRKAYLDHRKIAHPFRSQACLDIRVSKASLSRALQIAADIIATLERNDIKVKSNGGSKVL